MSYSLQFRFFFEVGWRFWVPAEGAGSTSVEKEQLFDLLVLNLSRCETQEKQETYWMVVLAKMSPFLL